MTTLTLKINQVINTVEREYRIPLLTALKFSDGDMVKFTEELEAMAWDYPDLDFEHVLERVNA